MIIWGYFIIPHFSFRWVPLVIYPILTLLEYATNGSGRFLTQVYYIINLGTIAALFCAIVNRKDLVLAKRLCVLLLCAFVINAITTYYGNLRFPNASRLLASSNSAGEYYTVFLKYNIGGFDVIYSLALAIPIAAIYFKILPKKLRALPILVMLLFLAAIVSSQYTIALVCALASLILFLIPLQTRPVFIVLFIVIPFSLYVFYNDSSSLFTAISSFSGSEAVNARMNDISSFLLGDYLDDESDVVGRFEKYQMSIKGFLSSPLLGGLGSSDKLDGGHSFIFDTPAKFGILGLLSLFFMFGAFYWKYIKAYCKESFYFFAKAIFYEYFILTLLNPQPFIPFISFALPLELYVLSSYPTKYQ